MPRHVERARRLVRPVVAAMSSTHRLRGSLERTAAAIALAMLMLVPLVASGHTHGRNELQPPCAACVVVHHAPAASGAIAPSTLHASLLTSVPVSSIAPPAKAAERSPDLSRAPPVRVAPAFVA